MLMIKKAEEALISRICLNLSVKSVWKTWQLKLVSKQIQNICEDASEQYNRALSNWGFLLQIKTHCDNVTHLVCAW